MTCIPVQSTEACHSLQRSLVNKALFAHLAVASELSTSFLAAKTKVNSIFAEFPEFERIEPEVQLAFFSSLLSWLQVTTKFLKLCLALMLALLLL